MVNGPFRPYVRHSTPWYEKEVTFNLKVLGFKLYGEKELKNVIPMFIGAILISIAALCFLLWLFASATEILAPVLGTPSLTTWQTLVLFFVIVMLSAGVGWGWRIGRDDND